MRKGASNQSPHFFASGDDAEMWSRLSIIEPRVMLKICPSKTSKIHPADAMSRTIHW